MLVLIFIVLGILVRNRKKKKQKKKDDTSLIGFLQKSPYGWLLSPFIFWFYSVIFQIKYNLIIHHCHHRLSSLQSEQCSCCIWYSRMTKRLRRLCQFVIGLITLHSLFKIQLTRWLYKIEFLLQMIKCTFSNKSWTDSTNTSKKTHSFKFSSIFQHIIMVNFQLRIHHLFKGFSYSSWITKSSSPMSSSSSSLMLGNWDSKGAFSSMDLSPWFLLALLILPPLFEFDFAWVNMCDFKFVDCANRLLHESNGQTYGLSPVCIRTCVRKLKSKLKRLPHPSKVH